jgi:hypothetical protein
MWHTPFYKPEVQQVGTFKRPYTLHAQLQSICTAQVNLATIPQVSVRHLHATAGGKHVLLA